MSKSFLARSRCAACGAQAQERGIPSGSTIFPIITDLSPSPSAFGQYGRPPSGCRQGAARIGDFGGNPSILMLQPAASQPLRCLPVFAIRLAWGLQAP